MFVVCAAMTPKLNQPQKARTATAKAMRFLSAMMALVQSRDLSRSNPSMLHTADAAHPAPNPGAVAGVIGGMPVVAAAVPIDGMAYGRCLLRPARPHELASERSAGRRERGRDLYRCCHGKPDRFMCFTGGHL